MSWPVREVTAGTPGITDLPGMLPVLSISIPVATGASKLDFSKICPKCHILYIIQSNMNLSHMNIVILRCNVTVAKFHSIYTVYRQGSAAKVMVLRRQNESHHVLGRVYMHFYHSKRVSIAPGHFEQAYCSIYTIENFATVTLHLKITIFI